MREAWLAILLVTTGMAGCLGTSTEEVTPASEAPPAAPSGFTDTHVFEGDYETEEPYSLTLEEGDFDVGVTEVLSVDSEVDGAGIQIGIVRPDVPDGTQVPVVVEASPYFQPLQEVDLEDVEPRLTDNLVEHGYAVAYVAVRGTADSGGCSDLFGPMEQADLDQAITWLGEQDWSNGNVGMIGVSYPGSTPWEVAAAGNEHLQTIVPISGLSDVYELTWRNGSGEVRGTAAVNVLYYAYGFAYNSPLNGRSVANTADGIACPAVAEGLAASTASTLTGERDPLGFWEERNYRPAVEENYDGSIFLVHGLQDWNVDPHHAIPWVPHLDEEHDLKVKYWLGQWGHAWPDGDYLDQPIRRVDFAEVLLRWFDHELKEDVEPDLGPKVQVQDHTGHWRSADTWPPQDTSPETFYLATDGELTREDDTGEDTVTVASGSNLLYGETHPGGAEPARDVACEGCAVFASEPLAEPLRFGGLGTFHVDVTPTGPGGHLAAFLYAEEDGTYERLGWTSMDLRFHAGGDQAQPVVPGERITAKMQFQPLDVAIEEDQRLVAVLAESMQQDRTSAAPPAPLQVHVGADASPLTLDTFTVDEEALFASPAE